MNEGIPDFANQAATAAWLKQQPHWVAQTIATRTTLRLLPLVVELHSQKVNAEGVSELYTDSEESKKLVHAAFLCCVLGQVGKLSEQNEGTVTFATEVSTGFSSSLKSNYSSEKSASPSSQSDHAMTAYACGDTALHTSSLLPSLLATAGLDDIASICVNSVKYVSRYGWAISFEEGLSVPLDYEASIDAISCFNSKDAKHVYQESIWYRAAPGWNMSMWAELRSMLKGDSPDWEFWIDWYERHLDGRPHNWDLLSRITLIDKKEWEKGPDHVNRIIAAMQHNMEAEARQVVRRAESGARKEIVRGIGDNMPPEPIEPDPITQIEFEVYQEIAYVSVSLMALEAETVSNEGADKEVVAERSEEIKASAGRLSVLLDTALTELAKESGKQMAQLLFKRLPYIIAGLTATYAAAQAWLQTLT